MKFRNDIGALRALAVLAVIFFHFQVPYFDGGFSGVDIFFVISGYLMTRIILKGFESNSFSFKQFYAKRITRIEAERRILETLPSPQEHSSWLGLLDEQARCPAKNCRPSSPDRGPRCLSTGEFDSLSHGGSADLKAKHARCRGMHAYRPFRRRRIAR